MIMTIEEINNSYDSRNDHINLRWRHKLTAISYISVRLAENVCFPKLLIEVEWKVWVVLKDLLIPSLAEALDRVRKWDDYNLYGDQKKNTLLLGGNENPL